MEDESNWKHLAAHLTVVSFDELPRSYKSSIWRFHPAEFISIFRQCEWLSKENLNDIYPDSLYNRNLTPDPSQLREKFRPHLNRAMRKYCISTTTRQAHFFGQGAIESAFLSLMIESSVNPSKNPEHASLKSEADGYYTSASDQYFNKYDYRLGNVDIGDGIKFRGRGMKQLTALENYSKYWVHRGWISRDSFSRKWWVDKSARTIGYKDLSQKSPVINDPQRLSIDEWNCIDAGAWYWEAGAARTGFNSINTSIKENGVAASDILVVTLAINGGTNGLTEREKQTQRISKVLMDQER
ncbi:MAG: hypothetical protein EOP70_10620 [Variovorax sp.]|nr:MAG: hypothetical protein EOP70_10620 [Variovorax sp.]